MNYTISTSTKQAFQEYGILNPSAALQQAITEDSNRVSDWQWYIEQLRDDAERRYCFERILYIDPTYREAWDALTPHNDPKRTKSRDPRLDSPVARLFRVWMSASS